MRNLKHVLVITLFVIIAVVILRLLDEGGMSYFLAIGSVMLGYQVVAFVFRNDLKWKGFYISQYNILTAKTKEALDFEIESETLFEKAKEVLATNGYKDLVIDKSQKLILAKEPISFKSWGENIYVSVVDKGNGNSELIYESVAFQAYTWGKNEDNGSRFLANMEESFII